MILVLKTTFNKLNNFYTKQMGRYCMKLLLKKDGQENGYWMKFPVTGKNGSRILETRRDISKVSESPYIDDVKC